MIILQHLQKPIYKLLYNEYNCCTMYKLLYNCCISFWKIFKDFWRSLKIFEINLLWRSLHNPSNIFENFCCFFIEIYKLGIFKNTFQDMKILEDLQSWKLNIFDSLRKIFWLNVL